MTKSICYIDVSGTKYWYLNGIQHRDDGSAIEYPDGSKFWYKNGKCHREDGPAIELVDESICGSKSWYLNDKFIGSSKPDNWNELVMLAQVEQVMND